LCNQDFHSRIEALHSGSKAFNAASEAFHAGSKASHTRSEAFHAHLIENEKIPFLEKY
jgi:hypothetical protein